MSKKHPGDKATMSSCSGYVIGGLAILVISFAATLAVLDYW